MSNRRSLMQPRVFLPLLGHILPTLVIGFGFVIPGSCIAGINALSIGFLATVIGFIPVYVLGVRLARNIDGESA